MLSGYGSSYQFTANLDLQHSQIDSSKYNNESDRDRVQVSGTYYFAPVKTAGHPIAEAAFLGRNSSLSLALTRDENDENERVDYSFGYEKTNYNSKETEAIVGGETYVFDNFLYLAGYVVDTAAKDKVSYTYTPSSNLQSIYTDSYSYEDSDNLIHMNLGLAPAPGLLIWSEFDENSDDYSGRNLNAKYVMEFGGSALNIQGGVGKNSATSLFATSLTPDAVRLNFISIDYDLTSAYILSDFYFTDSLSLGVGASHINIDNLRSAYDFDDVYMIRGQVFIADQVSIRASILKDDAEDSFHLGASVNF